MSEWEPVVRKDREKYLVRKERQRERQAALRVELEGVRRQINDLHLERNEQGMLLEAPWAEMDDFDVQASVRELDARITEAIAKEARLCAQLR